MSDSSAPVLIDLEWNRIPIPIDWIKEWESRSRRLPGPADEAVERAGKLPEIISQSGAIADPTQKRVLADGVPYAIVEQRMQLARDIVEHALLQDLSHAHVYPGAVIQGKSLLRGDVAPIPGSRAGGTINIVTGLITDTPKSQTVTVTAADESDVNDARSALLVSLNPTDSAGMLKYDFQSANSLRSGGLKLGLNLEGKVFNVDANVSLDSEYKRSTVMAVIRQVYYTTTFAPAAPGAKGIWTSSVDAQALIPYCGAGNPPLYIDSVHYGRLICITASGAQSRKKIEGALKASWKAAVSGSVTISGSDSEVLDSLDVMVYTIGVPGGGQFAKLDDPAAGLADVFRSGARFNLQNPGAPIAFTCRHVLDNTLAHVGVASEYVQPLSAQGENFSTGANPFLIWDGPGGGERATGVHVAPGDTIVIDGEGEIYSGVLFTGTHGPEGWPGYKPAAGAPCQEAHAVANSLIYRIGGAEWAQAGGFIQKQASVSEHGQLVLGINDDNPYNGDPKRKWRVHVQITRRNAEAAGIYI